MIRRAMILLVVAVLTSAGIAVLPSRAMIVIAANVLLMALVVVIGGALLCRTNQPHDGGRHGR